ncbi:esterase/lipase family protein [Conyzicola sp.]|uniref:esterase/lipase family protein n=1 Tax=Conyzicola sp. TaxID=1969404 RepID=UPI00398A0202
MIWQARALFNRTDPAGFLSGGLTPIVVVPGVWESWKFLQPLVTSMHERGHPVHVVRLLHSNSRPVMDEAAHVDAYLDEHDLTDVLLVAHSKGGLIGKYVMVKGSSAGRVRGMVAVATPFSGSRYARYLFLPSLRIFSPKDAVIVSLARELVVNERIVSVFGAFDPHIPGGSYLQGAKNVRLDTGGHFRVLAHPRVIAEVTRMAA